VKRDLTLPLAGIALLAGLTGCNLLSGDGGPKPTPDAVTSLAAPSTEAAPPTAEAPLSPSPSPETTAPMPTPTDGTANTSTSSPGASSTAESSSLTEAEADRIRLGLYTDEWARNIGKRFASDLDSVRGTGEATEPGALQKALEYLETNGKPEGFEMLFESTPNDNYTLSIWHPDAYTYDQQATAHIVSTGATTPTGTATTPPPLEERSPLKPIDFKTIQTLYLAASAIEAHERANNGELPTDAYLREMNTVFEGWEWSINQSPTAPDQRIIRVWHPEGEIHNSEKNAAYRDTFPKDDLRPEYNFDVELLFDVWARPPAHWTPSPIPTPTRG
jgi:hypothetical protein